MLMRNNHLPRNSSTSNECYRTSSLPKACAKLPPSWSNFAASMKYKRKEFSVSDLTNLLMWKKRQEEKTHMLELSREVQVPMGCRRRTSSPTTSRLRIIIRTNENFTGRKKGSQSTNFMNNNGNKK